MPSTPAGIFDIWSQQEDSNRETFFASGSVFLPSIGRKYSLIKGVLTTLPPIPTAGKVLHLPRKAADRRVQELRWIYDRRQLSEAKTDAAAWLGKWSPRYARLTGWVEECIEETFTFYRLPRQQAA